jgi:hypothetical protein
VDITDHKVKLVLVLPQQLQGCGCLPGCCHCDITSTSNLDRLALKSEAARRTHFPCESNLRKNHSHAEK